MMQNVVVRAVGKGVPVPIRDRRQARWSVIAAPRTTRHLCGHSKQNSQPSSISHAFPVTALSPFSSVETTTHQLRSIKSHQKASQSVFIHHISSKWPRLFAPPPLRWPRWPSRAPARPSSLSSFRSSLAPTLVRAAIEPLSLLKSS